MALTISGLPTFQQYQSDPTVKAKADSFFSSLGGPTNLQYEDQFQNPFGQLSSAVDRANQSQVLSGGANTGAINSNIINAAVKAGLVSGSITPDKNYFPDQNSLLKAYGGGATTLPSWVGTAAPFTPNKGQAQYGLPAGAPAGTAPQAMSIPSYGQDAPAAPPAPKPGDPGTVASNGTYVIQKGDTLSALAKKFGTDISTLVSLNPHIHNGLGITNPNLIYSGDSLNYPGAAGGANSGVGGAAGTLPPQTPAGGSGGSTGGNGAGTGTGAGTAPTTDPILTRIEAMLTQSQDAQTKLADLINSRNAVNTQISATPDQIAGNTKDYSVDASQLAGMTGKQIKTLTGLLNAYNDQISEVTPLANSGSISDLLNVAKYEQDQNQPVTIGGNLVQKQPDGSYKVVYDGSSSGDSSLPEIAKEYEFAKKQGYTGTFEQYENEDANRKKSTSTTINNSGYSTIDMSRFARTSNAIVSNFIALPAYSLVANGQPYLERIQAANSDPGSVSDAELLDSVTKLNTGGNQITDTQVKLITGGKSLSDVANVWQNQLNNGGVLSTSQRKQLTDLASKTFDKYKQSYQPIYDQVTKQLTDAGVPEAFWTIPDLNSLSSSSNASSSGFSINTPDGQTHTFKDQASLDAFKKAVGLN